MISALLRILLSLPRIPQATGLLPRSIDEVIFRLETDVFGSATHAGERIASIRVGKPLELPAEIERHDLPLWTRKLEEAVQDLLQLG